MKVTCALNLIYYVFIQSGNQKPQIEGHTIQWPTENGQEDILVHENTKQKMSNHFRFLMSSSYKAGD
jgi:hypothetical protein